MGFIKKVYAILLTQLAVTAGCITLVCTNAQGWCEQYYSGYTYCVIDSNTIAGWMQQNWGFLILAIFVTIGIEITLICGRHIARKVPINFVLLAIFTLAETYLVSYISSYYAV